MLQQPIRLHRFKRIIRFGCDAALRAGEARCVRGARCGRLSSGRLSQNVANCRISNEVICDPASNAVCSPDVQARKKNPSLARRANPHAVCAPSLTYSRTHLLAPSLTHSRMHLLTRAFTYSLAHALTHLLAHFLRALCEGLVRVREVLAGQGDAAFRRRAAVLRRAEMCKSALPALAMHARHIVAGACFLGKTARGRWRRDWKVWVRRRWDHGRGR